MNNRVAIACVMMAWLALAAACTDKRAKHDPSEPVLSRSEQALAIATFEGERVGQLAKDTAALQAAITAAIEAIDAAKTDAERAALQARLDELKSERNAFRMRLATAVEDAITTIQTIEADSESSPGAEQASAHMAQAKKAAKEAFERALAVERDVVELSLRFEQAASALADAQYDADRAAAKSRLEALMRKHDPRTKSRRQAHARPRSGE